MSPCSREAHGAAWHCSYSHCARSMSFSTWAQRRGSHWVISTWAANDCSVSAKRSSAGRRAVSMALLRVDRVGDHRVHDRGRGAGADPPARVTDLSAGFRPMEAGLFAVLRGEFFFRLRRAFKTFNFRIQRTVYNLVRTGGGLQRGRITSLSEHGFEVTVI